MLQTMEPRPDSTERKHIDPLALVAIALGAAGIVAGLAGPILMLTLPMAFGIAAVILGVASIVRQPAYTSIGAWVGAAAGAGALGVALLAYSQLPTAFR